MKKLTFFCWTSIILACGTSLSIAQSTTDCSTVPEDMARLKCYDAQAALRKKAAAPQAATTQAAQQPAAKAAVPASAPPVSAATSSAPAPATAAATSSAPAPATTAATSRAPAATSAATGSSAASSPSDFGLDPETVRRKQAAANPEAAPRPEQVVGRVKSVVTKPRGQYRITLEDGQVWEETQRTGGSPPEVGDTVTIRRGMLGSYFLSHSVGLALRVKRID
jgi:hypothetical protein